MAATENHYLYRPECLNGTLVVVALCCWFRLQVHARLEANGKHAVGIDGIKFGSEYHSVRLG